MKKWGEIFDSTAPDEELINLTPLIDVVFVVLIMFIIVAPLVEMESVSLVPASPIKREQAQNGGIKIVVSQNEEISVSRTVIPLEKLQNMLTELRVVHPNERPKLFHDSRASFGTYQRVKNAAEAAGFEQLDIIVKPD